MAKKTILFLAEILSFWFFLILLHNLFSYVAKLCKLNLNNFGGILIDWAIYGFIALLVAYIISKARRGWSLKDLGFRTHNGWWKDIWYGVVGFGIVLIINIPLDIAAMPARAEQVADFANSIANIILPLQILLIFGGTLVTGFITGAWHEEIHYRGYLQGAGSSEITPLAAILGSWFIFSFKHYFSQTGWTFTQVLGTLGAGLVFCLVYNATKSLIPAMVAHTLCNTLPAFPIFYYQLASKKAAYLTEAGLVCAVIIVLILSRKTVKHLWQSTIKLFKSKLLYSVIIGIILAAIGLLQIPARSYLKKVAGNTTYLIIIAVLAIFLLTLSITLKNNRK
jgi:membrane protease YdiL (CAAX protease family)